LTLAELVVIGLLAERPRHGYDLDQVIAERGMREWTPVAFSSLYYLLRKLETDGLIVRLTTVGDSRRRVFTVTDQGRQLAVQATREALATIAPAPAPVLVGLANAALLGAAAARDALRARAEALSAEITRVATHRDRHVGGPPVVAAMFDYPVALLDAERQWVLRTIEILELPDGQS
jgi:DNA-binding PadR family transcriptional regulator